MNNEVINISEMGVVMENSTLSMGNVARIDNGNIRLSGTAGGDILLYNQGQDVNNPSQEPLLTIGATRGIKMPNDPFVIGNVARIDNGNIRLSGTAGGDILLYNQGQDVNNPSQEPLLTIGATRGITMGNNTFLMGDVARINDGNIRLSGRAGGDILLYGEGQDVDSPTQEPTVHIDGGAGDIILRNADCAEEFDTLETEEIEPGTVMSIDSTTQLCVCRKSYDRKVAGVVSGAGGYKSGLILDKSLEKKNRFPVALMGKVYCKVDATIHSIEQGDLLTTSETPGHAMKAVDTQRSFGAIIGKALAPLRKGSGLIPILVALQ